MNKRMRLAHDQWSETELRPASLQLNCKRLHYSYLPAWKALAVFVKL